MSDIEEMRSFVQLVESGTATRAAEVRGLAVSAISRHLKDLEQRLGVQLAQRTTRSMTLTDEGRLFHARAVSILADINNAEAEVSQHGKALSGSLRIAAPLSFGLSHLSPAIAAFMQAEPELLIDIDMSDRRVDLVEEGFDLAIRISKLEDSSLMARKLADVEHAVCASPDFLQRHGVPEHPSDIEGLPGLCYANPNSHSTWSYTGPNQQSGNVSVNTRLKSNNGDVLRDAAVAGHGIICEPGFVVQSAIENGTLVKLFPRYQWSSMGIYAMYPRTRHLSARARRFIDFLVDRFNEKLL